VSETRRKNMKILADEAGGFSQLADLMGVEQSYISQLIGKNPSKNIGAKTARSAEAATNKVDGWLDKDHDAAILNRDLLLAINTYIDEKYPKLSADLRSNLIADMYFESAGNDVPADKVKISIDMWIKGRNY